MRILIRLPNWLGDLIMSTAFVRELSKAFPEAEIDVIVKKGIDAVVDYVPGIHKKWVFSKDEFPGLTGAWKFGRMVGASFKPDILYCLPDSFSSAVMARATGAPVRMGYKNEFRSFLLTKTSVKKSALHRVDQYLQLLSLQNIPKPSHPAVFLQNRSQLNPNRILVNVNSEAESRRLPVEKAVAVLNLLRASTDAEIVMIGGPKEVPHVEAVFQKLKNKEGVSFMAGKTNLHQLIDLLGSATVMLTTDSGPMHLANAMGVHTVSLFGAGNENNTGPYNRANREIVRSGLLACEPCVRNTCKYGLPKCLINMEESVIVASVLGAMK